MVKKRTFFFCLQVPFLGARTPWDEAGSGPDLSLLVNGEVGDGAV